MLEEIVDDLKDMAPVLVYKFNGLSISFTCMGIGYFQEKADEIFDRPFPEVKVDEFLTLSTELRIHLFNFLAIFVLLLLLEDHQAIDCPTVAMLLNAGIPDIWNSLLHEFNCQIFRLFIDVVLFDELGHIGNHFFHKESFCCLAFTFSISSHPAEAG